MSEKEVSGVTYLIFDEDVECNDDRIFLKFNNLIITVNFFTQSLDPREGITDFGLNSNSLINLYDIVCDDDDPFTRGITIAEKAKRIIWDRDLVEFLNSSNFKFRDSSTLTIPEVSPEYNL